MRQQRQQTLEHVDERISVAALSDGRHLVMQTPGKVQIYVTVLNGVAAGFEAEDVAGERQGLFTIVPDSADAHLSPDGLCEVCTYDATFDSVFCYTLIECPPTLLEPKLKGPHIPS